MEYKNIKNITPEEMCVILNCPQIYEARSGSCQDVYLIAGKAVDPKEVGLEKKVGEGEILIEIPKKLLDEIRINAGFY